MGRNERVAIVGIGGIFPGSPDLERFWANIAGAVDATSEVPPGRWPLDPADAFDPRVGTPDRVYSTRGGFVEGFRLDPDGLDIEPDLLARLDPMFHLALHAGRQAWRDAVTTDLDRRRVGVVFGNIVLPTDTTSALTRECLGRTFAERSDVPAGPAEPIEPRNTLAAGLPAGLLARTFKFGGGTFTLDAACASSLYALKLASDELLAGRTDAMLTGGLSRPDPLYTQMGFSQLRALSGRGKAAPFDARGDGLIVGEGAGMFVLKRLSDAVRHGDTIYGIIAAVGLSNDVEGGLLAPSSEGQLRAMRAAYDRAGWDPCDVDLIECHATGTPVGDAVEFASLRALWGGDGWAPGRCVLGSIKSNIGHALTAAGAAGLLKVLLALKHEALPPTANFRTPAPGLGSEGGPFRVLAEPEPWAPGRPGRPRRAAISGFGFGGINAHALIEEWVPSGAPACSVAIPRPAPEAMPIAIIGMAAHFGPFRGLRAFQERVLGGAVPDTPVEPRNWWGVQDAAWFRREGLDPRAFRGYYLDELSRRPDRFRFPPRELEEMLPQQSLALRVAAEAIADAGWDDRPRLRAGVYVGIGLDLNTTNFHLRWLLLNRAREWDRRLGLGLSDDELACWARALRDAAGPPLTANRTMGALGGLVASRIAREFRIGGPSFTVSGEETSGARALDVAVRLLRQGELDEAIVGAVDLAGDPRAVLSMRRIHPFSTSGTARPLDPEADGAVPGEGAAALVLKRRDDAIRDGDRIYAVVRGVGAASGSGTPAYRAALDRGYAEAGIAPASVGYLEANGSGRPDEDGREAEALADFARTWPGGAACALGSVKADVGHTGAASALASIVKAALCLHQQMLPPLRGTTRLRPELASEASPFVVPRGPQFWLRDRIEGPRRAAVSTLGSDGNCLHVVLEEAREAATDVRSAVERVQPLGARRAALFAVEADDAAGLLRQVDALEALASRSSAWPVETLARRWWKERPNDPGRRLGLALVADGLAALRDRLGAARRALTTGEEAASFRSEGVGSAFLPPRDRSPLGPGAGVAFVFPGVGNQFVGMGRDLSAQWPEVLRAQDEENERLRSQLAPGSFWNADPPDVFPDHRAPILGQVALGTIVGDLLRGLGVRPDAMIGYSLGESAGLFALRAWTGRDEMLRRIQASPLFRTELAGPCEAARRAWGLGAGEAVDWVAGILPCSAEAVRAALPGRSRVYLLVVNTPREVVVGGRREAVLRLAEDLGGRLLPLPIVSTVHCEVAREVEDAYRAMHLLETTPPAGVRFYSGARGRAYDLDREAAADAIVAHALHGVDFPAVVERAYGDGLRAFVEIGPGGSCARMIGQILAGRPHLARSACLPGLDAVVTILELLGHLIAERLPVDLGPLYGRETRAVAHAWGPHPTIPAPRMLTVHVGGRPFEVPRPPAIESPRSASSDQRSAKATPDVIEPQTAPQRSVISSPRSAEEIGPLGRQVLATEGAKGEAHEAFLRASGHLARTMSNQLAFQMALIEALMDEPAGSHEAPPRSWPLPIEPHTQPSPTRGEDPPFPPPPMEGGGRRPDRPAGPPRSLDRAHCLEFAVGSIGAVLGPEYAAIDDHPTRVRLPDEPLMLVDRILAIEGEPRSLTSGRVVTEHDVLPGAWYLDAGRIPTCIAVESGQADLFLSGYLGIDFATKGRAVYRLLDAAVTFHRGLPGPGEVIRYDIRIAQFFRQGDTYLFRFQFEATVGGEPLMTMRDGCAGFFTAEELAAGQGIVQAALDRRPRPGVRPADWDDLVPMAVASYDDAQVEALRRGDLAAAFGPSFEGLTLDDPVRLPGGRMTLVHRISELDPAGGRFGIGFIRGEADIHPDDWFMTCHFVDDRVMPGTLMYECCLHTLRIYLMRLGWVGERDEVAWEPIPGAASRLKCRGQVVETTRTATYEVSIRELGYHPEPYAIVDAMMLADGKPIVEIADMSLRLTGQTREGLRRLWARRRALTAAVEVPSRPLFDRDRILAFAIGKPSEAFGERYRAFDEGRYIARLPGPPYSFLDRITRIEAEPWKMVAGGVIEAQYDVPPDAWYFAADRQERMPYAVLLEVALQPCGWLAAYIGSALTSDVPLKFRNLGGQAVQQALVTPRTGPLATTVKITKVSRSAGMIIQHFDFDVRAGGRPVYRGDTYFGFFREEALADQVGLHEAEPDRPGADELARARRFAFPTEAPLPDDRLRMLDRIEAFVPDGGPRGLGFIEGTKDVDPSAWFFKAHFYQDPVCPGSLGLESLLQLLKVVAVERWGAGPGAAFESVGLGDAHRWIYRGQVMPTHGR
ncbi:MAG TPA: beta-ketoacyl synthase N-terminal-like domain-containing protein, partial [Isosphaeraceae bacterium]|nr:beta-ketoacyl synthase N-terminal-like domain-containing protein [Isosphaeraceae bacterium]